MISASSGATSWACGSSVSLEALGEKGHQRSCGSQVAASSGLNKRLGDGARLGDFNFAVALAKSHHLAELIEQLSPQTPNGFRAPARVPANAGLELSSHRRVLIADRFTCFVSFVMGCSIALYGLDRAIGKLPIGRIGRGLR